MPRSISLAGLQAIMKQEPDEQFMELIEIDHDDMTVPLRFCNDKANITSNGDVYTAFPFSISLPSDEEDRIGEVQLIIVVLDQVIQTEVRALSTSPDITLSVITRSAPNTIEAGPFAFTVTSVEFDGPIATFTLGFNRILFEDTFPKGVFGPANAKAE